MWALGRRGDLPHGAEEVSSGAWEVVLREVRATSSAWGVAPGRLPEGGDIGARPGRTGRWRRGKECPPGREGVRLRDGARPGLRTIQCPREASQVLEF